MQTKQHGTGGSSTGPHEQNGTQKYEPKPALYDIEQLSALGLGSTRHIRRLVDAGKAPQPLRLGKSLRWRVETGDPTTGILDWIQAGCPRCDRRPS